MATKIRLQRGGHKGYAVYRIVIADVRAPRDGKFIEKIGMFNPNTNPATVDLNFDAWKAAKEQKLNAALDAQSKSRQEAAAKALEAEKKVNETIAKKVADKKAAEAAAKAEAEAAKAAEAAQAAEADNAEAPAEA